MKERINVAELIKDCPKGMELDCVMYEDVKFISVEEDDKPICIRTGDIYRYLTKFGTWTFDDNAKCVIFPKGKTTWKGFVPPCKYKAGDVLVSENGNIVLLSHIDSENRVHYHCIIPTYGSFRIEENTNIGVGRYYECVLANEQQRQIMYDRIKYFGYKYNQHINKLEKLVKPKFKVGDRIKNKNSGTCDKVIEIFEDCYLVESFLDEQFTIGFDIQDNWVLVPNKFDITTLIPFESRVLVRDYSYSVWRVSLWGCLINNEYGFKYDTIRGAYKQCIPYENNEHLLGKTDNCDEYYKTWE